MSKTHLTLSDRVRIQSGLDKSESFKKIAEAIGKDCTTVSREVRNHFVVERTGGHGKGYNDCLNKYSCKATNGECANDKCSKTTCRYCPSFCMTSLCPSYVREKCVRLKKPPYVCNGCPSRPNCNLEKLIYRPQKAQAEYEHTLSGCRSGFVIGEDEAMELGSTLKEGLKKGQSVYHIIKPVGEEAVGYSAKTIYTYIDAGVFEGIGNLDLPRKVRYKKRKKSCQQNVKKDKACRIGRTYADYLAFRQENPDVVIVEMDTVEGKKGVEEKCLLTIHLTNCRLMLAFIRDRNSAASVVEVFDRLRTLLGNDTYARLFPVLVTDNGGEFSDPCPIEMDSRSGEILSQVFYCDPGQSQQKGACENNHELIRRVIPKGKSMNPYTQEKIDLMMSHINSYLRAELGGRSPYDVFAFMYGTDILDKLNIRRIEPSEVVLKPSLLD